jgi:hypothetical protein
MSDEDDFEDGDEEEGNFFDYLEMSLDDGFDQISLFDGLKERDQFWSFGLK